MKSCLTIFCLIALAGVINSANLACEAGKEQMLQATCAACSTSSTYLLCGDKTMAVFETQNNNNNAVATTYGHICKSNQFFKDNSAATNPKVADTCDVGPLDCLTVASKTTCATCFPGWFLRTNDTICIQCPEKWAYTGCKSGATDVSYVAIAADAAPAKCQAGFTLDNATPKKCIPCVGDNVATCTAVTGATITTAAGYKSCMQGFFFTGLGSYTVDTTAKTSTLNDGTIVVTGTAAVAQSDVAQCRRCPNTCLEKGYNDCVGVSIDGKFLTDYDFEAAVNTTFRGTCRCMEGELYQVDTMGHGMCTSECMFGTYSPESLTETKCRSCHDDCAECWGPSSTECFFCAPWAFMVDGKEGMCVTKCPAGYKSQGSNSTSFNSQFCMEDTTVKGGFDLTTDVVDPTCTGQNCIECSGPAEDNCLKCSGNSFLYLGICQSECPRGFYEDKASLACIQCHPTCETCYGPNPEDCLSCQIAAIESNVGIFNLYNEKDKTCHQTCPANFYQQAGENLCQSCGDNCVVCDQVTKGDCLACNSKTALVEGQCHISCPKGFYMDSQDLTDKLNEMICMPCGNGCSECYDDRLCLNCDKNKFLNAKDPSMCVSDCTLLPDDFATANYNFFKNATMSVCQEKPSYCAVGSGVVNATAKYGEGSATECTTYLQDATTNSAVFTLPFYDKFGVKIYGAGSDTASTIKELTYIWLKPNEWVSQAADDAVGKINKCELTLPGCASCSNAHTCFECKKPAKGDFVTYKLLLWQCVEMCPPGTYSNKANKCMPCEGCSECVGPAKTDCTSCDMFWGQDINADTKAVTGNWKGLFKPTTDQVQTIGGKQVAIKGKQKGKEIKGQCVKTCGDGYFMARNQRECLPCSKMCATCFDETDMCLTPKTGNVEFMGKFYATCPTGMVSTETTFGELKWNVCSCSLDCTTNSCIIFEEMHEEFCYACKNDTYWSFTEIGKCYSATKKCPASVTTPWGEILPVYPDGRDATAKVCSFKCPSGTYKNMLGGSTNENTTCVTDCTNKTLVTNWNDQIHVVDRWAKTCSNLQKGCSFGYGLLSTCTDDADPLTCTWSCEACPSKCADCYMQDDDWCPVCASGYLRHFGAWGIEECIGGGTEKECADGYQKQQVGYFHYYDDEDTVDYDIVVDNFKSEYSDKFDNTMFKVDGCLLTDTTCLGSRNDTCKVNCTGDATSATYLACVDKKFELNCNGDNIAKGATTGGFVFNEDSQFDYDTQDFTIIENGVEKTFTNETKGTIETKVGASTLPPLKRQLAEGDFVQKTEFELQEEDKEDLKNFAKGLKEDEKHKTYAVAKDGSVEELGMAQLVEPEEIKEWEMKMVGSQEKFGAGADSTYCIPCEFNCNTCPEGYFEEEQEFLKYDETAAVDGDDSSGFVTMTAKNCKEECDLGDFAHFQNIYNSTSYTLDASDYDTFYTFMHDIAPDMFNWKMSCLVNNAPSIRKLTGGLIKHPISQPLFIGADVAKLRGYKSVTWELVKTTELKMTTDRKLTLVEKTTIGYFEEDSAEGYCDLVVPVKSLKAGKRYTFRLNVTNDAGMDSASWEVEVERGMTVGTFAVSPATGKAMITDFSLNIGGYTYPNGSLFFQVYAYITDVFAKEKTVDATTDATTTVAATTGRILQDATNTTTAATAGKKAPKGKGPAKEGDLSLKEMMDTGSFGADEDFDTENMVDADEWEDQWNFYAEEYTYTVVWELTEGPEILSKDGSIQNFGYQFPDDEALMIEDNTLTLEVSIFSYEFPWVWHYQEFKDIVAITALSDTELDAMMDAFFAGEQSFATSAAASNFMDSAFTKNFADMDTDTADADSMWKGGSDNTNMKSKGQVGFINPDHLDFQALLYTMEDATFEELQEYGCSLYNCNVTGTLETVGEGCKLYEEDDEFWMKCNCKTGFFGPKCKDDAAANTKKKQYFNQSITQIAKLLNTDGTMDSSKAKDAMKMMGKMFKVGKGIETTKAQKTQQMTLLVSAVTVVPITDSKGYAQVSTAVMSALNNQKTDVNGETYAADFNTSRELTVHGNDATNVTAPSAAEMKANWVDYCNSSSAMQAQLYIAKALKKPTQSAKEWEGNATNQALCVDADITDEILFRAVLKYYAFNEKKTMISKLLNAEGKVQEKAAAVATGTVGAGALESTNSDKVSVIVVVDQSKDNTIGATPTTTVADTTTTTTTRSLQTSTANSATATTSTDSYTASAIVPQSVYSHSNFVGYSSFQVQIAQYTSNPLPQKTTDNLVTNVVDLKIYGKNTAGTSVVLNAWDTAALTINIPKTVDTSALKTDNTTTAASKYICKYWDSTYLIWKTDGCTLKSEESTYFVCECTHTTEFAVALDASAITAGTTTVVSGTTAGSSVVFNMMFAVIALIFMFMQ